MKGKAGVRFAGCRQRVCQGGGFFVFGNVDSGFCCLCLRCGCCPEDGGFPTAFLQAEMRYGGSFFEVFPVRCKEGGKMTWMLHEGSRKRTIAVTEGDRKACMRFQVSANLPDGLSEVCPATVDWE